MSDALVERLREPDWHDPACPFKPHCYCEDGAPHDRVSHPLAKQAADRIESLLKQVEDMREALEDLVSSVEAENERGVGVSGTLMSDMRQARAALSAMGPSEQQPRRRQYTLKGVESEAIELMRNAAQREGMKISAWVSQRLRQAAERSLSADGSEDNLQPIETMTVASGDFEGPNKRAEPKPRAL